MDPCKDCKQSIGELVAAVRQHAVQVHCEALEEHNRNLSVSLVRAAPRTPETHKLVKTRLGTP